MNYIIKIEGQDIPVPEEIGATDEMVKNALKPVFPEVANASLTRTTKDDLTTITVIKRAGSKGGWQELITAPEGRNPVITLQRDLADVNPNRLPVDQLLKMDRKITKAVEEGDRQNGAVGHAFHRLKKSKAIPATFVPRGF